jgi:hypothetical protein
VISKHKEELEESVAILHHYLMDDSMINVLDFHRSTPPQNGMPTPAQVTYSTRRIALMDRLRTESRSQSHLEGRINEVALATYLEHGIDMMAILDAQGYHLEWGSGNGQAGVMVALGKYQQAYDFLKFCLSGSERHGNHGCETPAFLQLKGANMLEPLELVHISHSCDLWQVLEMALLKLYVFSDVRGAQLFAQKYGFDHDLVSFVCGDFQGEAHIGNPQLL